MSILSQVKTGKITLPYFVAIFGEAGSGKTTWAAGAPKPIFACIEEGANELDIARLPTIDSYEKMVDSIKALLNEKHDYQTLVIDSMDHFEPILNQHVCKKNDWKTLEDGSYGKGVSAANAQWGEFFGLLKELRKKMNLVLIAHTQTKSFSDPTLPAPFDRTTMKLSKGASALTKENVDALLYLAYDQSVVIDKTTKKGRGFGGEERVTFTQYRSAHDGKNRFGLPYKIETSYKAFDDAVKTARPGNVDVLIETINGIMEDVKLKVKDQEMLTKIHERVQAAVLERDAVKLVAIVNRLNEIIKE